MTIELKQSCTACGRSLKIRLEDVPEADFYINCPKCKADQLVRAGDVAAVAGATAVSPDVPGGAPAAMTAAPSAPDERDSLGFGAQDLTGSLMKMGRAERGATPAFVDRDGPSLSSSKVLPRNAPRTTPRAGTPTAPVFAIAGGVAGGLVVLLLLVWLLWPGGGTGEIRPSSDIQEDIASITGRYEETGAGGTAPDLFREGLDLFRSDAYSDHRDAADRFRRALVAAPHHPEPLAALALNSVFLPRSDRDGIGVAQANVWADHVQRVLPESLLGSAARASLLSSMGRHADAIQLAQKQVEKHDASAHAWFVLGHVQRATEPARAAESLRRALELDPAYRLAQTELAEAELAAGRIRAAAEAIAARDRMGSPSSHSERIAAALAGRLGDETTALTRLETAVKLEAKDVDARLAWGWRLLVAGRTAEAAKQARHVLEVDHPAEDASEGQAADARLLLAETLRRTGDARVAVDTIKPIVRVHAKRGAAQYLLGLAQLAAGDEDTAAETLREAAKLEPRAIVFVALGMALARGGQPEDAVGAYLEALEKDGGEVLARAGLASIYADAQLPTRAIEEWEKMLAEGSALAPLTRAVEPRFPRPPLDLAAEFQRMRRGETTDPNRDNRYRFYEAVLLCESGRVSEGLARVSRIRRFDPAHGFALAGWALAAGRTKDALRFTTGARTPEQNAARGWALQAARANGAETSFRRALQSYANEPYARLGLAQLLVSRGQRREALELLDGAERALGPVPALLKARVEAGGP